MPAPDTKFPQTPQTQQATQSSSEENLKRTMGYWTILALSIGSLLGTTLFFGAPIGAKYSGNLLIVAWIILSLIALYIGSIFGELSAMFPKTGGAYEFSKRAYGKFFSFIIAWTAWLFGSLTTVTIIIAAVTALNLGLGDFPNFLISVFLIVLLNIIAYLGMEVGSFMLVLLGIIMVGIPVVIIVTGVGAINPAFLQPLVTHKWSAIFVTLFFMAEAYFGGESATYLAEETRNPKKVIPRAILHATAIIGVLGLLMIIVTLGLIPWQELVNVKSPVTDIAGMLYGDVGKIVVIIGVFIALTGTAVSTVLSMPRLLLALARDRLFLGQFKVLHPRFKTPQSAILFQTVMLVMLLLLGFANYQVMLELLVPMAALLYASLAGALLVLRRKMPNEPRAFKVPFSPWGPLVIIAFFVGIVLAWLVTVPGASIFLNISLSLIALGIPLYFLIEMYYDPKMITTINDVFAYATFAAQKVTRSGSSTRKKILGIIGPLKGKTVLEYGCGVGTLTLQLIEAVGPSGRVYATHFSKNNVKITKKRLELRRWEVESWSYGKVQVIHDPQQLIRVHPSIGYADSVVSVGMLGYMQDIERVLKEIYTILPVGGKICFVEHSDFFHLLPNVEWLVSDRLIERMFRRCNFSVRVKREKGLLWNTIFVYGIKFSGEMPFI